MPANDGRPKASALRPRPAELEELHIDTYPVVADNDRPEATALSSGGLGLSPRIARFVTGAVALCVACFCGSATATAAEVTEIVDTYPVSAGDSPLRAAVSLDWRWSERKSRVRREFVCTPATMTGSGQACPDGPTVLLANDAQSRTVFSEVRLTAAIAYAGWARLHLQLPIVVGHRVGLTYDQDVDGTNSLSAPLDRPGVIGLPHRGPVRSGVGDVALGLRLTPVSAARDGGTFTWALDLDVGLPTAARRGVNNDDVGEKVWTIDVGTAFSGRPTPWAEPFLRLGARFRSATDASRYVNLGPTHEGSGPQQEVGVRAGVEFIPFERPALKSSVRILVGASADIVLGGRAHTSLFEALGASACDPASSEAPCDLTTFTRGDIDPVTGLPRKADGVTNTDQFMRFGLSVGVRYEVFETLQLTANAHVGWETAHFLTNADAGVDLDGEDDIQASNADGDNELSPTYNSNYDQPGGRFRATDIQSVGVNLGIQARF